MRDGRTNHLGKAHLLSRMSSSPSKSYKGRKRHIIPNQSKSIARFNVALTVNGQRTAFSQSVSGQSDPRMADTRMIKVPHVIQAPGADVKTKRTGIGISCCHAQAIFENLPCLATRRTCCLSYSDDHMEYQIETRIAKQ